MQTAQRVFISYRRSDCQSQANGLNDGLRNRLPDAQIFMDLDSIPPGADFEEHIREEIEQCDVVLVMIGDQWLDPRPGTETRRIDEPNDFVRLEVMTALSSRQVRVIPVLVEGARMPEAAQLPDDIARLARLNAFVLSDSHWGRDLQELTNHLGGAQAPASDATVSFADIDANAVSYAVAASPRHFATKDVSTHAAMLATHEGVATRSNYHTMVGRFLMQNRGELGLESPEPPHDDRGSRWTKVSVPTAPAPMNPKPFVPTVRKQVESESKPIFGRWIVAAPILSAGLLAFLPPLLVANRLQHDPARQRKMRLTSGVLGAIALVAFIMVGSGPTDAEGTPTGVASDVGMFVLLACMTVSVIVAVKNRKPSPALAGTEGELMRRDLRRQYRELVGRDASLAASMRVGRPDVAREYDDGGLVDLNSMPADGLQRFAGMTHAEATDVVRVRGELGRLSGLNDLEAFSTLSQSTLARLREIAVFV
jgi:hypothetical protein